MSPWTKLVAFGAGFVGAFGLTVLIGSLGPSPVPVWALVIVIAFAIHRIPKLDPATARISSIASYSLPFLTLWMLSNPTEALGPTKSSLYWLTMALLALGSLAAGLATFSSYQKNPKARAIIAALVPIFVCAWLVAYFSSSTGAGGHMIEWFIRHLSMDRASAQRLSFAVRKSIHFLFYGLFGLFAYRAASKGGIRNSVLAGVAFSVFHAAFDELRQAGYADRTGSFWDVLLDLSGAVVFVLCAAFLRQARDPSKARR